ncbi:phosphoserine phosphatase SerB [bacterium]|nr:phosphoserine phosphatase SerB [bacterium]
MPLVLTLAKKTPKDAGLADLTARALGRRGEVHRLGGRDWSVFETRIDPGTANDLVAWLKPLADEAKFDWSLSPEEGRRKRLLVSDMDSTIIGQECLDELADYAGVKAEVASITERAMRGELDFEAALIERVAMLKGLPVSALMRCYEDRVRLNPGARTLTATMRRSGARCVLVSGGFTFFTERVARDAGFDAHRANTLVEADGGLTGAVARPILGREAKLAALKEEAAALGIDLAATLAIGDGANDLAMIEASGLGVAFRAKPIVADRTRARIAHTDLTAALFFQGYHEGELTAD